MKRIDIEITDIQEIAYKCGFKMFEQLCGPMDFDPNVYKFAEMLLDLVNSILEISSNEQEISSNEQEISPQPVHDPVNHPSHYTSHPSGIEAIEITRHMSFNLGNAMKYLWRNGLKDGQPAVQDLEKAVWYIQDEIKQLKALEDKNT